MKRTRQTATAALALALCLLMVNGCAKKTQRLKPNRPTSATYTGPKYLYNTVGSLSRLQNNNFLPVTGYGLVVDLEGTGSNEVPAALRQWLLNEMAKNGVGMTRHQETLRATPQQLLASQDTAVVRVLGLIPPGAVAGSKFDLLIQAEDSQSTSLMGGRLWTSSLSPSGVNPAAAFTEPAARGRGEVYVDPVENDVKDPLELEKQRREAIIVDGGTVTKTRQIELVLNQPSRSRARMIANRINERFPAEPDAKFQTAIAKSPLVIKLNFPRRYLDDQKLFIDMIQYTYIDRSRDFEVYQAERLAEELLKDPRKDREIRLAWKALGPLSIPVLRQYYQHENVFIRLAALDAGAYLSDERASVSLLELSKQEQPEVRRLAAEALVRLPQSIRGQRALRLLLDDDVRSVRIAAYESLSRIDSPLVDRTVIQGPVILGQPELKLVIDRVPATKPLIYISQKQYPRLVIFDTNLGFKAPTMQGIWDNKLMIRREADDAPAKLFFQRTEIEENRRVIKTHQHDFYPTLATLAYILAHRASFDEPQAGFDLTYGQVVDAIYQLAQTSAIEAEVEINRSVLAILLDQTEQNPEGDPVRPETGPAPTERPETPPTPTADLNRTLPQP